MSNRPAPRKRNPSSLSSPEVFGAKEFSFFAGILREISENLNLDALIEKIVEKVPLFLKGHDCVLFLLQENKKFYAVAEKHSGGREILATLHPQEGIAGLALRDGKPRVIQKILRGSRDPLQEAARKGGYDSFICLPLWAKGKPIGILIALTRNPRQYREKEVVLAAAFAEQAACAIENSWSYQKIHNRLKKIAHFQKREKERINLLEKIAYHSTDPVLVTDIHGKFSFINKRAEEIFGYSLEEIIGKKVSEFYRKGEKEAKRIMKVLLKEGRIWNDEAEFVKKDGQSALLIFSASILRDKQGQPTGVLGAGKEITEYQELLNRISKTEKSYQKLFEAVNDAIFSLNQEGYFQTFNRMFLKMVGYTENEIKSFHFSKLLYPKDALMMVNDFQKAMGGASVPERYTFRVVNKEEEIIFVEGKFRRLKENDQVVGVLGVLRDVTEKIKLEQELLKLSITDGLTGLHNQRHFHKILSNEMERTRRQKNALSLLLFDLDDFKAYNDIHGHLEGDRVLKKVADAVQKNIRKVDSAYRYGGDEFTVILPGAGKREANRVAERIKKAIEKNPDLPHICLSIGLVEFDPQMDMATFIKNADEAMYSAKKFGGNRIFIFPEIKNKPSSPPPSLSEPTKIIP